MTSLIVRELPENFTLKRGGHQSPEDGMCLMEAVAFLAGEEHSANPQCACPRIAAFGIRANDAFADDEMRTRNLLPLAKKIIGTRSTKAVEQRREYIALDMSLREIVPLWLDQSPELTEHAVALRALPEIVDAASYERASKALEAASDAAREIRRKNIAALEAKIKDALVKATPGLSDRIWAAVVAAEAETAAAAAVTAAVTAVVVAEAVEAAEAAEAAVAAAAAAVPAVPAVAAVAAAVTAVMAVMAVAAAVTAVTAVVAVAVAAAVAAMATVLEREKNESHDDYYWRVRVAAYPVIYPAVRKAVTEAFSDDTRVAYRGALEKTWEINAKCLDQMIACT